jgi:hypothetical protein
METQELAATSLLHQTELIFNLNTRLFVNSLAGITEEQATIRISDHNNPVNWLAAHTVGARFGIIAMLGKPAVNPYEGLFEKFKPFDASQDYGSLAKAKTEWKKATVLLQSALSGVTEGYMTGESPLKSPIGDFTNAGTMAFLAHHETYQIGQIAFLKKYLTGEAMSYFD